MSLKKYRTVVWTNNNTKKPTAI